MSDDGSEVHVLSLGAGVQSSALALMAAAGEIGPMPAAAVFADTQAEPASVYTWLDWLEAQLPFPVHRVSWRNIEEDSLRILVSKNTGKKYVNLRLPVFTSGGELKREGMLGRRCTERFKLEPLYREMKKIARAVGATSVFSWVGISTDEAQRMKPSRDPFVVTRWPLIDAGISRRGCLEWMAKSGHPPPPRSACVFCPFHSDAEWKRMKLEEPAEFERAAAFEQRLQASAAQSEALDDNVWLHRSCKPLAEVDFDDNSRQLDLFGNECEGICGV